MYDKGGEFIAYKFKNILIENEYGINTSRFPQEPTGKRNREYNISSTREPYTNI